MCGVWCIVQVSLWEELCLRWHACYYGSAALQQLPSQVTAMISCMAASADVQSMLSGAVSHVLVPMCDVKGG